MASTNFPEKSVTEEEAKSVQARMDLKARIEARMQELAKDPELRDLQEKEAMEFFKKNPELLKANADMKVKLKRKFRR